MLLINFKMPLNFIRMLHRTFLKELLIKMLLVNMPIITFYICAVAWTKLTRQVAFLVAI
jgi:hypothetical protein